MKIQIDKNEYEQLRKSKRKLDALEAGGVDSWEGYSISLESVWKDERLENVVETYLENILQVCSEEGDVDYPAGRECGHSILLDDAEKGVRDLLISFIYEYNREAEDAE